ncbi:MAG: cupin domain-containing protein [Calditrichaeota bacterium]|nr:cupin domain-containing protein [Calditrichota bacterium]
MEKTSTKLNLNELAQYQDGSVVSKALLAKKGGNITLFAFAKGEGLSEHTAPFDAFVHILDGKTEITISGKEYILNAGEMIIMPANEPHALKAIEAFKMLLVMIKSENKG